MLFILISIPSDTDMLCPKFSKMHFWYHWIRLNEQNRMLTPDMSYLISKPPLIGIK